ncbi:helix-turn-helix domain-containing protein [Salmonella enterica subsp. enterica serovar Typhimurium]|uniref:helix-turn-helix domain-containing protein n=1 Tax=Salmonella enterica TaxID=28901 RepID=UPI0010939CD2|nr:helix-turn-helix domain-containing protein [Salmonella enterica]EEI8445314.1 helix-turn-helix domain-containing protein [Salmonella enterica subsp. enterica serovar Typhimurium]EHB2061278.1 helix-turn-helix domain-containing protein [Salmonella enterica subsp. enterica serovar Typhimurium]EHB2121552.1 helix-turn-helix domain-containing protein [Salmonella enterica subsp. enterica serovar Typhimurium]EHC8843521.1 helix-turn-helix domain-containing protein [Salmonella enterica subsp. enterica 
MTKVKRHFTNKSNNTCLPTSKAIIYNEVMSDNTLTNGLISRLAELNKKGFSKTEMARVAGVSKQAVSSWFKTGRISKSSALAIADAAGVSVPWLLGEDVGEKDGLKPDEQRLLELYRQLPEEEQQNMMRVFSLRLKELDELYAKYMSRRIKGEGA